MKLIDKLFEKLGYTKIKDAHRTIEFYKRKYLHLVEGLITPQNDFSIYTDSEEGCFVVYRRIPGVSLAIKIKKFYFKDDARYALLCARELVEELKKEI
jgi:hypothetical protein